MAREGLCSVPVAVTPPLWLAEALVRCAGLAGISGRWRTGEVWRGGFRRMNESWAVMGRLGRAGLRLAPPWPPHRRPWMGGGS
jgi:hypothetical protein